MRIPTSEEAQNNRIRNMFIINWKMDAKHGGLHQYGESRWCRQYRSAPNWHELILDTTVPPSSVACATGLSRTQTANFTFINKYLASFNKQKECQFQQVTEKKNKTMSTFISKKTSWHQFSLAETRFLYIFISILIPYFIITFEKTGVENNSCAFHISCSTGLLWLMGSMCTMPELQEVFSHTFLSVVKWDAENSDNSQMLICLRFHTTHYPWE